MIPVQGSFGARHTFYDENTWKQVCFNYLVTIQQRV